jgi:hypothetical protein
VTRATSKWAHVSYSDAETYLLLGAAAVIAAAQQQQQADPFLHKLYDRLHDSPMQTKFRSIAPVPIGVVFLPWAGITEAEIRQQFRTMKKLGFNNLKQVMPTPEWSDERLLQIAFDEGIIRSGTAKADGKISRLNCSTS